MVARRFPAILLAVGLLLVATACGDDGDTSGSGGGQGVPSTVDATLSEYEIELSTSRARAGAVTFNARNAGSIEHELLVIKSERDSGKLPVRDSVVPEEEVEVIDEIPEFEAGTSQSATFDLAPGAYVLICNIPGHYEQGMHTSLTVEA